MADKQRVLNKRTDVIPPDAILVDRTTKWGNHTKVQEIKRLFPGITTRDANQKATDWYREYIKLKPSLMNSLHELAGKDLVCWDAPLPCHADVLLEMANKEVNK